MSEAWLFFLKVFVLGGVAVIAYGLGKHFEHRRKQLTMESLTFLQAIKWLLLHEKSRHYDDIAAINKDLDKLRDVPMNDSVDYDYWIVLK